MKSPNGNLSSTDPTDQRAEAPRVPRDGTGGVLPLRFQDFSRYLGETSNISWFISMFQIEGVIKKKYLLDTDFSKFQPKDEGFFWFPSG